MGFILLGQQARYLTLYEAGETRRPLFTHKDSHGLDLSYAPGVENHVFYVPLHFKPQADTAPEP